MVLNCEPQCVMKYFEEICSIPHGSGNTKLISDYLMDFAAEHNLKARQDESNNVIIWKDATADKKNSEPVILQGHMDMVCVKEDGTTKDMDKEGLDLEIKDGFIEAKGTSLGGDDGIAVAYALAILADDNISHPDITAVFTVDEEIGMLGATAIDMSDVRGTLMLNMDSEDEGIFLISCAGGATAECILPVEWTKLNGTVYTVEFTGFCGGHSGTEINKNRANTNVLMGRFMLELNEIMPYSIVEMSGGEKDNAISKVSRARFIVQNSDEEAFENKIKEFENTIKKEFSVTEKNMKISCKRQLSGESIALDSSSVVRIMMALNYIPNGVQKMSSNIEGLVQTSLNLGVMALDKENMKLKYSVRSSVRSEKEALLTKMDNLTQFLGGNLDVSGNYPAWEYKEESKLRKQMIESYENLFGKTPKIEAIHAGVECGIMASKINDLDCVSFGPQMYDIHTVNERMDIKSVERTWKLIIDVLSNI